MKNTYTWLIISFITCFLFPVKIQSQIKQNTYPGGVETVLKKSGKNRAELEKFLMYCRHSRDPLKWDAACFLIRNMDIHYSEVYHWVDEKNNKIEYNELSYSNFSQAIKAFENLSSEVKMKPVISKVYDMHVIKADYLIKNLELALSAWESPLGRHLSFDEFCEYLLPYRNITEALEDWRLVYRQTFSPKNKESGKTQVKEATNLLNNRLTGYFVSSFSYEDKRSPVSFISPSQMLFRKRGHCEDMVNFTLFAFKSQGIPCRIDMVPYHGTSTGRHYWNVAVDKQHRIIPFEGSNNTVDKFMLKREPSKVISITYAKQPDALASLIPKEEIPENYLQNANFIDVTNQYWPVQDMKVQLNRTDNKQVAYVAVLNGLTWRPAYWGKIENNWVVFPKMACGVVYLPMIYNQGELFPAAYPVILFPDKRTLTLVPDKKNTRRIRLEEQAGYLKFRQGSTYKLYYWDHKWVLAGSKFITNQTTLYFNSIPDNALLLLVPNHSSRKERPFYIDKTGKRYWW